MATAETMQSVMQGTLSLTLQVRTTLPTLRETSDALETVRRTLDLGWTSVPLDILTAEHPTRCLPALPNYRVRFLHMASPLEVMLVVPQEVLGIPAAIIGLSVAVERVLNCTLRIITKREQLEAEFIEHQEHRMLAEERIRRRIDATLTGHPELRMTRATSAKLRVEED